MRRGDVVVAMVVVLVLPGWAYATPGDLDPSFGVGGVVTTRVGTIDSTVNALAIQPDGKIVAAGYAFNAGSNPSFPNDGLALVRYETDGSLDATWRVGGIAGTPIGTFKGIANAVALQRDGKVVAAGVAIFTTPPFLAICDELQRLLHEHGRLTAVRLDVLAGHDDDAAARRRSVDGSLDRLGGLEKPRSLLRQDAYQPRSKGRLR